MKILRNSNLAVVVAFFSAATARAAVISVTTTADSGLGSLRVALAEAAEGDTIDATGVSGTILLTGGELLVTRSISILGPGPAVLAVDGNAASRVFHLTNVAAATISGLTVTNGNASQVAFRYPGGGIYNDNSTLTVSNCTISGNSANLPDYVGYGGGVFNRNSTLTLLASVISSNSANTGGGIYNDSSTLTLTNCSISGNLATGHGGGIYSLSSIPYSNTMVSVAKSVFIGNTADYGGGIFNDTKALANAMLSVSDCTISSNTVTPQGGGGGIYTGSETWVSHCTISFNTAAGGGGLDNASTLWLSNCTVIGNEAEGAGGGIYDDLGATATVAHCVVSGNSAGTNSLAYGLGGGICGFGGTETLTVISSAIDDNTAGSGLGGGVFSEVSEGEAALTFVDSSVSQNSAAFGGGICNFGEVGNTTFVVSNCMISFNAAPTGGGIVNHCAIGSSVLAIAGSTIASNTAGGVGGGIYNSAGEVTLYRSDSDSVEVDIINSTLSGNAAGQSGSALYNLCLGDGLNNATATARIINSTLSGNLTPPGGADIQNSAAVNSASAMFIGSTILNSGGSGLSVSNERGTVTSLGFNLSSDGGGGLLTNPTDLLNLDPLLGPLQDNGGPTFTHALLPGSPAVDQGNNFSGSLYDQRGPGYIRTFDDPLVPNAPDGDGTDIGAFEAQKSLLTPAQAVQRMLDLVNSQWTRPQPLRATLDAALASINQGNPTTAVSQLQAFENQVRAQVAGTDPALAQTLLLGGQGIIENLVEMVGSP